MSGSARARRAALAAWSAGLLAASSASAAVFLPGADFKSVADRVHAFTVFVRAHAYVAGHDSGGHLHVDEGVSVASGVLVGGGLALTDLASVTVPGHDGMPEPADAIEVAVPEVGSVPAKVVGIVSDLGLAVLRLSDEARELPGATLQPSDPNEKQALIAIGAGESRLTAVTVVAGPPDGADVIRLPIDRALPDLFRGAPLFDEQGRLSAVIVRSGAGAEAAPVSHLRPILDKLLGSNGI